MSSRPHRPGPSTPAPGKISLPELAVMKQQRRPISMVTAYDFPSAQIANAAGVEMVLVGDSAAMVVLLVTDTLVAAVPPMVTAVAPVKFVPVIVTLVPPVVVPDVGLIAVTVGGATYV